MWQAGHGQAGHIVQGAWGTAGGAALQRLAISLQLAVGRLSGTRLVGPGSALQGACTTLHASLQA